MKLENEEPKPQIAIYQTLGNEQKIRVRIEDENVWLTQKLMAALFDVDVRTINEHLTNIYLEKELVEQATIWNFRIVQKEASREVAREMIKKLDEFLTVSEKQLLHSAGSVSALDAEKKALEEFGKYRQDRDRKYVSDFDREVKRVLEMGKKRGGDKV